MSRPVSRWPSYLLKDIPVTRRRRLSKTAAAWDVSVADVVRSLLCARYALDCPPESYGYDRSRDTKATTIVLRLQPELVKKLAGEGRRGNGTKKKIILEAIETHYKKGEPSHV